MFDFKKRKILFIVAHPDDEVLGPGATISYLANKLHAQVQVLILGEGLTSRDNKRDASARSDDLNKHQSDIHAAKEILGYSKVHIEHFPDNRFDGVETLDIIKVIEKISSEFPPDYVFTHHPGDLNVDHRKTCEAVLTAFRPLPGSRVKGIFTFETLSSTEWSFQVDPVGFRPNFYFVVEEQDLENKINAMEAYKFEKRPAPHPRSSEVLKANAVLNGSRVGVKYAEPFSIVRMVHGP